jgi:hypothetical protein
MQISGGKKNESRVAIVKHTQIQERAILDREIVRLCIKATAGRSSFKLQIIIHLSFFFHPRPIMKAAATQLFLYFHLEEIFN